ncbi:hypothetical protein MANES_13G062900v8 [Manihot esculenta]|uniref:Uncharacterized protein n=1 Tax=Manihot esculenta TaxID=3983 RepID=A0A2C9URB6_MANES|nr:hypothetical protein MANES_13G062900v8 [Manihot esculenta]
MGRKNGDATVASSSIALLQERFRELQRIRERRQEKELLKLFSEPERSAPAGMNFDPSKMTFHQPEMIRAPPLQDSHLSLGLNSLSSNNHADIIKTPTSLWPSTGSSSRNFENSDVDTSLHL